MNNDKKKLGFWGVVRRVAITGAFVAVAGWAVTFAPVVFGLGSAASATVAGVASAGLVIGIGSTLVSGTLIAGRAIVRGVGKLINFFRTPKEVRQENKKERKKQREQERQRRRDRGPRNPNGPAPVLKAAKKLKMKNKKAKKQILKRIKDLLKDGKIEEARAELDAIKEVLSSAKEAAKLLTNKKERKALINETENLLAKGSIEEVYNILADKSGEKDNDTNNEQYEEINDEVNNEVVQEEVNNDVQEEVVEQPVKVSKPKFSVKNLSEENQEIYKNIIKNKTFENGLRQMEYSEISALNDTYAKAVKEIKKKPIEEITAEEVETIATYKKISKIYKEKKAHVNVEEADSKVKEALNKSNDEPKKR